MADLAKLAEELSGLTVLEAAELSKMLEEKWGVSAAAPVAAAAPAAGGAAAAPAAPAEEGVHDVAEPAEALREGVAASRAAALGLVVAIGWALTRKVAAAFDAYLEGELGENADWLQRRRRTQLIVFRRLAVSAGITLTAGLVLTAPMSERRELIDALTARGIRLVRIIAATEARGLVME